tara:strand:+ start:177 stop:896 length:720 start_codon:yes stop_codon:yes gene_type:complete
MKGIILAAGRGSRMGALTDNSPKALLTVRGQSLIDLQLSAFKNAGINDVTIVTGYLSEMLRSYGTCQAHNSKWNQTNMVSSLLSVSSILSKHNCIVSYADIFYKTSAIQDLKLDNRKIAICYDPNWLDLWSRRFNDPIDDAENFKIDQNSFVTDIGRPIKNINDVDGQFMGITKYTPAGWSLVESILGSSNINDISNMDTTTLLRKLVAVYPGILGAVKYLDDWGEVDSMSDLILYNNE